jgi:hypothetical protein
MKNYESIEKFSESKDVDLLLFRKTKKQFSILNRTVYFTVLIIGIISCLYVILHRQTNDSLTEETLNLMSSDIISIRCNTSDNCCGSEDTIPCPICHAIPPTKQRVRRNVFQLSPQEFSKYADAMWVMKKTSIEEGTAKYGKSFRNYDYLIAKHVAAVNDYRGDRAHDNTAFLVWHAAFELEFENSMLAIDPSIEATVYYNWNDTAHNAFNEVYFGSAPATGPNNELIDGPFAYWPIRNMTEEIWTELYSMYLVNASQILYTGDTASGKFRSTIECSTSDVMLRYGNITVDGTGALDCTSNNVFPFLTFLMCIDSVTYRALHGYLHYGVGGSSDETGCSGDLNSNDCSPNDVVFFAHHTNLDRYMHSFQRNNADTAPYYYGYPVDGYVYNGNDDSTEIGLLDTLSSNFCITDEDLQIFIHDDPLTCWKMYEVICYLQYDKAPYTYDELV